MAIGEIRTAVVPAEVGRPTDLGALDQGQGGSPFLDTLRGFIDAARAKELQAGAQVDEFAVQSTGQIHETTLAVTQAEIAFRLLMSVRNRLIETYREVMRMGG